MSTSEKNRDETAQGTSEDSAPESSEVSENSEASEDSEAPENTEDSEAPENTEAPEASESTEDAESPSVSPFGVGSLEELAEKLTSLASFKKALAEAASQGGDSAGAGNTQKTKEALGEVVTSALFESGILEKMIDRQVERRLGKGGGEARIHAKVKEMLSGEEVKIMLDDKFRAMSLYLKGEVIPKTVKKILNETGVTSE